MSLLIDVYTSMVKEAEAQAEVAERVDILSKYASAAEELLQASFPNDYTKEDVIELADRLIAKDAVETEEAEKTAEYEQLGAELFNDIIKEL